MTEPTATHNPSLIARLWALPKRFTAAFVLSILLFGWICFAGMRPHGFSCQQDCPVYYDDLQHTPKMVAFVERVGYAFTCGGVINGSGDTAGKLKLPLGTICREQESSVGPGDVLEWDDYSPQMTTVLLGNALFLFIQMALAFAFAALKERGVKVSIGKRLLFHIFLPLGLAVAFMFSLFFLEFPQIPSGSLPTMVVLWPLWILLSAAIFIIARVLVDRKAPAEDAPKSSAFARSLRGALWALLPAIVFWFIRNAILPLPYAHSQYPLDHPFAGVIDFCDFALALIYFFLFTAGFAWLFMAACPRPQTNEG